jgi:hypothetical protein
MVPFEGLLDRRAPVLHRLVQRMRRRHPVGNAQIELLVLRDRDARAHRQRGTKQDGSPVHEYPPCPARIRGRADR